MLLKFEIGQLVEKWTGDYTGPGRVRGVSVLENGKVRYLVGHRIEGGHGEFLHVYSSGNLREPEGLDDLPAISKEEGLRTRTGLATPEDTELVDALVEAHRQVDALLAMVVTMDKSFFPSQSPLWPEIERRAELIQKHGATL
jgi:hypothetical protein